MVRYHDDDESGAGHALLITAGVAAGLLAGAVVAQRLGGWKGLRKILRKRRHPIQAALARAIPGGIIGTLIDTIGVDEIVSALLGGSSRSRPRRRRPHDDEDLDEYELDEVERATAGLDDEDGEARLRSLRSAAEDLDAEDADMEDAEDAEDADDDAYDEIVDEDEDEDEGEDEDEDEDAEEDEEGENEIVDEEESAEEEDDDQDDDADDEALADEEDEIVETYAPEDIEEAVLAAFRRHPVLQKRALEIAVDEDGILCLTGWVRRERELRIARRVAARVPGVERVVVDVAIRDGTRSGTRSAVRAIVPPEDGAGVRAPGHDTVSAGTDAGDA